ncbi:hypothetical protein [Streptomyces sp. WP-1]|uniref:hypothetical protein n=1 Tax=Streptomyces sp. WP-1 TaxID=3041497 RepID=UPI0026498BA2|nr:hypothetical protein [Streptomyces sp. WP-1]WKE69915.1 hypothetical protein QHG49_13105 [Streptomyces sp. WP-1]
MTSSLFRGRPRCAKAHIRVRVTHAVLGALVGAGWLMLPLMTAATRRPVPATSPGALADAAAPGPGGASAADYVLPFIAVAAAAVMAAYGYLRRVRRARTRTTPGTTPPGPPAPPTVADAERQARIALVLADDCVRTSREELGFVRERFGAVEKTRTGAIPVTGAAAGTEAETDTASRTGGGTGGGARAAGVQGAQAEEGPPTTDGARTGAIPAAAMAAEPGATPGTEAEGGTRTAGDEGTQAEEEPPTTDGARTGAPTEAAVTAEPGATPGTEAEGGTRTAGDARAQAEEEPPTTDGARTGAIPAAAVTADTEGAPGAGAGARRGGLGDEAAMETKGRAATAARFGAGAAADRRSRQGSEAGAGARGAESADGAFGCPPQEVGARDRAVAEMETETAAFVRALRGAEAELAAAFAMWWRYERGLPGEAGARRQALAGVVGRCAEAGRRLDAQAAALDQVRGLEGPGAGPALDVAEGRFRGLAVRAVAAHATLAASRERYAPSATGPVTGSVEQAKDRLLFATAHLNAARRSIDSADGDGTARNLRAAEGAVAQAEILVTGVDRLAARLREAAALVPAALTGAEAELTAARHGRSRTSPATGELNARLAHADGVLAAVREELTGALPYDPLDALRRITRAVGRLDVGRSGVLDTAALLVARASLDTADDFVTVHRGAVGPEARALLSEALRALTTGTGTAFEADTAAREARDLAERDVRAHGTPCPDATATGLPGAVLGGILLAEDPDGGPPATFGGPATRGRRHVRTPV